jgi:signal transduction histidine kinase
VQRRRDEYLAFVAHDLRTPLNAIGLSARVIGTLHPELGADPGTAKLLKALQRNVHTLEALVEQVLKESEHVQTDGGVKLRRRHLDLWPLVEALVYDFHPVAATAGAQLINSVPLEQTVFADAALLRRVFQNLIANALSYAPRGEVTIGARQTRDGTVECLVVDNGAGIPRDRLEVIFEKMETDPDNDGGTGLGLAIVKTFVEAHGGVVEVDSREGIGTTFRFTIPGA